MFTFRAVAQASKFTFTSLDLSGSGTVDRKDGVAAFKRNLDPVKPFYDMRVRQDMATRDEKASPRRPRQIIGFFCGFPALCGYFFALVG